jgi:hypothetical protein
MKSLKWALLALTLITISLNSCKKSDSKKAATVTNSIALKFNGTAYTTNTITAVYSQGAIQIIGTYANGAVLYIAIPSNVKVGSFDLSTGGGAATFGTNSTNTYIGDAGTINITSFTSNTVTGNFEFKGTNILDSSTCSVTSGTFQTPYTTQ